MAISTDLWVDERVVIELKAVQAIAREHELQLVNYLTATLVEVGLLLNFGSSVQVRRKFREYQRKGSLLNAILPPSTLALKIVPDELNDPS